MTTTATAVLLLVALAAAAQAAMPAFPLHNTAAPGVAYPAVGLGTGGYGLVPEAISKQPGGYPECWAEKVPGCGDSTTRAVKTWLQLGGRRIDSANSYFNQDAVRKGIEASGVPRSEIFITSKVGPSNPLGYQDTLDQMQGILEKLNVTYVDLLLIHWPTYSPGPLSPGQSSDPACVTNKPTYNAKQCRLNTWRAMVEIFGNGTAKAVGVSNFNSTHIEEIKAAGMPLPAVNQCPFNIARSSSQSDIVNYCKANNILFNGYSPLGIPDLTVNVSRTASLLLHKYPPPLPANLLDAPAVHQIAAAHSITPAQAMLAWQYQLGIPTNPRCWNATHMRENMAVFDVKLSDDEMKTMSGFPQDSCASDKSFYECWNSSQ